MKRILCFGDSNTWGAIPGSVDRYDDHTRYTKVLATLLGDGYDVIEEGMPGRTTVYYTDIDPHVCGMDYLIPCLISHAPLDAVVIMLGTNDLSVGANVNAYYAAAGVDRLVKVIRHQCADGGHAQPGILIVSPPLIDECVATVPVMCEVFNAAHAPAQSRLFAKHFGDVANALGCMFIDGSEYTRAGSDGVHITAESHRRLAEAICDALTGAWRK